MKVAVESAPTYHPRIKNDSYQHLHGISIFRMFGLRNVPFATGRVISWHQEIEPIAGELLRNITTVEAGMLSPNTSPSQQLSEFSSKFILCLCEQQGHP